MSYENLITKKEENIGWIIINRPVKLNALNAGAIKELHRFCVCLDIAKEIINNDPLAFEYSIEAINKGLDQALDGGLLLEAELFGKACSTEDSKEGTKAFLEKRKANFKGT